MPGLFLSVQGHPSSLDLKFPVTVTWCYLRRDRGKMEKGFFPRCKL
ncbi:MAG: hypothetical protein RMY31_020140 [Dendronalium sp. ChiSLP03b]